MIICWECKKKHVQSQGCYSCRFFAPRSEDAMNKSIPVGSPQGFTLIELLVVVLIIGILASIALPQYTKAVERARTTEAIEKLSSLTKGVKLFYMENDRFPQNLADINNMVITYSNASTPNYSIGFGVDPTNQHGQVIAERTSGTYQYGRLMIDIAQNGTETRICASDPSHALSATKQREFCSMVETAGYIQGVITGGGEPI